MQKSTATLLGTTLEIQLGNNHSTHDTREVTKH